MRAQPPLPVWSVGGGSCKSVSIYTSEVEPWFLEHFSPADEPDKDGLYSRALGLRFQLDKRHFNNPLELKCSATVGGHTWDRVISPGLATLTNQKLAQESLRRGPDVGHLLPGNCVTPRCPEVLTLAAISTTSTDKQLQQNIIKRVHSNLLSSQENTANMVEVTGTGSKTLSRDRRHSVMVIVYHSGSSILILTFTLSNAASESSIFLKILTLSDADSESSIFLQILTLSDADSESSIFLQILTLSDAASDSSIFLKTLTLSDVASDSSIFLQILTLSDATFPNQIPPTVIPPTVIPPTVIPPTVIPLSNSNSIACH
uniref:Uncharacterized protein n=1 Tax=Timema monikensis TaxID=170555 RepID=A0A7R9HUX7_9NEOP|nr:unnamed protein product [Timema monikensis]